MTVGSDNVFPKLILSEGAAPATPASGQIKIYAKADGLPYSKDDAGTETPLGGSGSSPTSSAGTATVATNESTASTSYTDLATSGPAVTVTVNTKCLVFVACRMNGGSGEYGRMSFAASSANTVAADDARCTGDGEGPFDSRVSVPILLTGLTPGSTVFTAKYKAIAGTVDFQNRTIIVVPLD